MTETTTTINKKRFYKVDHTTYGGEISLFDFEGHNTMTSMAIKITKDKRFDEQCKKVIELKNERSNQNCLKKK